jgi:hypothetical protein
MLKLSCTEQEYRTSLILKHRITDAITTIDQGMLQRTWQEIEYRFDVLRATNGANIEVYEMRQKI